MDNLNIRELKENEYKILDNFLYEAVFIPKGTKKPPREIIDNEELQVYVKDNVKSIRKLKGLSQKELAIKLNIVRQTVSKWEQGLSVPDSGISVSILEVLEIPVNTLLGENTSESIERKLEYGIIQY